LSHLNVKPLLRHIISFYVHLRRYFVVRLDILRKIFFSIFLYYSKFIPNNSTFLRNI